MENFRKLQKTVAYAYKKTPAFRKRMDAAALRPEQIRTLDDFAEIPVLRKERLIDLQKQAPPFGALLGKKPHKLQRIFQSPGPIYDPQGRGKDYWRWARPLAVAGFGKGDIVLNTFSYHLSPAGFMFDDGLRTVGATVVPTGVGNTELQVRIIADLQANGYVGTPSFLLTLLQKADELGTDFTIKKAFLGAEPFFPKQKETFAKRGIDAFQGYGTADVGAIAFECMRREGMHIASGLLLEIVDVNTGAPVLAGETGEIVVTLFDKTYPLIRFGTGDLSKMLAAPCSCGLESARIAGYLGRTGEAVKVRGMFVHPRQLADALKAFPEIGNFSAEISRGEDRDFFRLLLETSTPEGGAALENALLQKLRDILRVKPDEIDFVDSITSDKANVIRDLRNP